MMYSKKKVGEMRKKNIVVERMESIASVHVLHRYYYILQNLLRKYTNFAPACIKSTCIYINVDIIFILIN